MRTYHGAYGESSFATSIMERTNLVKAESMDLNNDPRFFQGSIINQRLAAFGGLAVISGLLVQNAMDHMMNINKSMSLVPTDGFDRFVTFLAFITLMFVFYGNMLAVYVGVAQPYHAIRLSTAGPTGFEASAAYYLASEICAWRHLAVKTMLLTLPMYVISIGFRIMVKFEVETKDGDESLPEDTPWDAKLQGIVFGFMLILSGLGLWRVHHIHTKVFRDQYQYIHEVVDSHVQTVMAPASSGGRRGGPLDV